MWLTYVAFLPPGVIDELVLAGVCPPWLPLPKRALTNDSLARGAPKRFGAVSKGLVSTAGATRSFLPARRLTAELTRRYCYAKARSAPEARQRRCFICTHKMNFIDSLAATAAAFAAASTEHRL